MSRLAVKGWAKFQHYKHRKPPWIKLHRDLLDNHDFARLPVASRALAPLLWLLASESDDGTIQDDTEFISFRCRFPEKVTAEAIISLLNNGFLQRLQDASDLLAERKQNVSTETETETEGEREAEAEAEADLRSAAALRVRPKRTNPQNAETWNAYAEAYRQRYSTDPVRNAKVNGQVAQIVKRIGAEAPAVARFFVGLNTAWYVQKCHSLDCLVKDAEAVRMQWATGRAVTAAQARQADSSMTNAETYRILKSEMEADGNGDAKH